MKPRKKKDPAREAVHAGWAKVVASPLFRAHGDYSGFYGWTPLDADEDGVLGREAWARVGSHGRILHHATLRADPAEWAWVFGHLLLHLGLGHTDPREAGPGDLGDHGPGGTWPDAAYRAACCLAADRFLLPLRLGRAPYPLPPAFPSGQERALAEQWREASVPAELRPFGPLDFVIAEEPTDFQDEFAAGVANAATAALDLAGGVGVDGHRREPQAWDRALGWFVSSYPLLGALAAGMTVVADAELARGWDISIAAVSSEAAEIYVNPLRTMSEDEWRFVLAHEMLHAALRHGERVGGRDPYIWNVACDYVVNGWLVEMGVGEMPEGLLYDPTLAGLSGEAVYDRIVTDVRRLRKLATLRGRGVGDVLDRPVPHPGTGGRYVDLDDYYRSALATGLAYHHSAGRGTVPAGLEQAIRALEHPPLPWDAALARWFDEHVPSVDRRRSYARASRRQAASPGIPRPGWVRPEELVRQATFGVVLDTSGSMEVKLLGKALGAIASYATARDVPRARVVFCDAAAYDAGYLPVEEIAHRVRVRGRGGTVLQPGVNLLERADDFPPDGPILVITDGACDVLRIRREHAFLVPQGASLPFRPRGPVFRMR